MTHETTRDNGHRSGGRRFNEPRWLAWLHLRRARTLQINEATAHVGDRCIAYADILAVEGQAAWWAWQRLGYRRLWVHFQIGEAKHRCGYLMEAHDRSQAGHALSNAIAAWVQQRLTELETRLARLTTAMEKVYDPSRYLRYSLAKRLIREQERAYAELHADWQSIGRHSRLTSTQKCRIADVLQVLSTWSDRFLDGDEARTKHNGIFLAQMRAAEAAFFASVESSPLTEEQIDAVLTFDDATLVVAAAGSGKSSCIVAKIGFAIKRKLFDPSEILALAYNKDAAKSLGKRLSTKLEKALGQKIQVQSRTFHSFGLAKLIEHHGEGYEPKVLKEDENEEGRFLKNAISTLFESDGKFRSALAQWLLLVPFDDPQPVGVAGDVDQCARLYEECCRERIRAKRNNDRKRYEPSVPTFNDDIYVRSLEERSIVNWLTLRGVDFVYEKADWDGAKRLGITTGPYKPDFTYTRTETLPSRKTRSVRIVHEHFALDRDGKAPSWMGGDAYVDQANRKRRMFAKWCKESKGERLIFFETTSAQFRDGTIWQSLESSLQAAGVVLHEPSNAIYRKALAGFRESTELEKLIIDFVLRFKESGLTQAAVEADASSQPHPYRTRLFLRVAFSVFHAYQLALEKAEKIDYADMLRESLSLLKSNHVVPESERDLSPGRRRYRFVLVDEFQDISRLRADVVRAVLDQAADDSIVFCVGDDWQTINRFSGSDVSIFSGIGAYFDRHVTEVTLSKTFRCADGIAQASRQLVLRNANQINKPVTAAPARLVDCVRVIFHSGESHERVDAVIAELERISVTAKHIGLNKPTVKILMRTTADTTAPRGFEDEKVTNKLIARFSNRLQLQVQSLHKSKGLEADFVVLVGLDSGFRGFPDERSPEPLLDLVLPKLRDPNEEERRLLYVGLTRARHQVSILADCEAPSEYALELKELARTHSFIECVDGTTDRSPCPQCKVGSLRSRPNSSVRSCTRQVRCGYRERSKKATSGNAPEQ